MQIMNDRIKEIGKMIDGLSDPELQHIHKITQNVVKERSSVFKVRFEMAASSTLWRNPDRVETVYKPILVFDRDSEGNIQEDFAGATHTLNFNVFTKEFISIEPITESKVERMNEKIRQHFGIGEL
jgi:hypothetical protein